jgi:hypothetical protein
LGDKGAIFSDCRRIGWMEVMCKFGIVDCSLSGECGGSSGSRGKDRERTGGKEKERRRE